MSPPEVTREIILQIYGCPFVGACPKANSDCPMIQTVVVKTGLRPRRMSRRIPVSPEETAIFEEAVTGVGLIRRIEGGGRPSTLAQDMRDNRENDQYLCDKVGSRRGRIFIRPE